ncbi:MAG: NAD(P)H-binding protein, partial [Planctomycetota bacterium]
MKIFLTGATGYIGGRLAPLLLERGHELVCLARDPRKLHDRGWVPSDRVTIVGGDLADTPGVVQAAQGCDVAYYLVHSMESGSHDFAERDRALASSFSRAMRESEVEHIVYLGGLGELGPDLSEHLRSRREVERVLESSGVPVTTFRAAMILGSGSASFEILRYLVERLPAMVTPKWVNTRCQPISVVDVLGYLVDCLELTETTGADVEIGGPAVLTYRELMDEMQRQLGLSKRFIVPLPVLTPRLSSLWIGLVTPVSPAIARPLAEGLRNEVVVTNDDAQRLMPRHTLPPREAIRRALERVAHNEVATRWSAAGPIPGDPDWAGGTSFVDQRAITIDATAHDV